MFIPKHSSAKGLRILTALLAAFSLFQAGCQNRNGDSVGGAARGPIQSQSRLAIPGEKDLVVFIAEFKPTLYRLAGRRPAPWGDARFYSPVAIIADARTRCFFVLDQPMHNDEPFKIWRIDAAGHGVVVYQSPRGASSFSWIQGLGQDSQGQLILTDAGSGLWRLEPDGQLINLFSPQPPVNNFTAGTSGSDGKLYIVSSYRNQVVSRDIIVNTIHTQGGLYRLTPTGQTHLESLVPNQRPGAPEFDTHWRQVRQLFKDVAGRLLLVDAGSVKSGNNQSEILGGVLAFQPGNGQLTDLTYTAPQGNSGPMRHPRGIEQWDAESYIVADPGMVVEGINGPGGLLILHGNGRREALWPFGYRLRPCGVAVLRGVNPAPLPPALPIDPAVIAGKYGGGEPHIGSLKWERQKTTSYAPGDLLYGLDVVSGMMTPLEEGPARSRLYSIWEHAEWIIAPDGSLRLESPAGTLDGKLTINADYALASLAYKRENAFDTKTHTVDAMLFRTQSGQLQASISFSYMDNKDRVTAEFEQLLTRR
jgi:hypothetical protein